MIDNNLPEHLTECTAKLPSVSTVIMEHFKIQICVGFTNAGELAMEIVEKINDEPNKLCCL